MNISREQAVEIAEKAKSGMARLRGMARRSEHTVSRLVQTAEVMVAAGVWGGVEGRLGHEISIMHIPAPLLVGALLHITAIAGVGGRAAEHLQGFGDGSLAAFAHTLGMGAGARMRPGGAGTTARGMGGGTVAGAMGGGPTDSELRAVAERAAREAAQAATSR